jgi:hypothetical protein
MGTLWLGLAGEALKERHHKMFYMLDIEGASFYKNQAHHEVSWNTGTHFLTLRTEGVVYRKLLLRKRG